MLPSKPNERHIYLKKKNQHTEVKPSLASLYASMRDDDTEHQKTWMNLIALASLIASLPRHGRIDGRSHIVSCVACSLSQNVVCNCCCNKRSQFWMSLNHHFVENICFFVPIEFPIALWQRLETLQSLEQVLDSSSDVRCRRLTSGVI